SRKIGTFGHGFTYSGHPVAAAVALKALDIYARERIAEQAARKAPQFQARLAALGKHPLVGEARGLGLVGAVEPVAGKKTTRSVEAKAGVGARAVRCAEQEGLIVLPRRRYRIDLSAAHHRAGGDRRTVRPPRPRARSNPGLGQARTAHGRLKLQK